MAKITKSFLENTVCEDLNKEFELNKFELPKAEDVYNFYLKVFEDWEKEQLEEYAETEPELVYSTIIMRYVFEGLKINWVDWITLDMLVEGTLENTIYKAYYEGRKRPWEK